MLCFNFNFGVASSLNFLLYSGLRSEVWLVEDGGCGASLNIAAKMQEKP
jgi:hypothetical protein